MKIGIICFIFGKCEIKLTIEKDNGIISEKYRVSDDREKGE